MEIELSYPESASLPHIQGMTFSSPEKVPPTKEKTDEPEQACEDAGRLIPEEENPQLDFVEETTVPPNDRITEEMTSIDPDNLVAGTAKRVDFSRVHITNWSGFRLNSITLRLPYRVQSRHSARVLTQM